MTYKVFCYYYYKQKVDNTRYTLFIKDKIAYSVGATNDRAQFPTVNHNGIFSEAKYYRVREKLNIEVIFKSIKPNC